MIQRLIRVTGILAGIAASSYCQEPDTLRFWSDATANRHPEEILDIMQKQADRKWPHLRYLKPGGRDDSSNARMSRLGFNVLAAIRHYSKTDQRSGSYETRLNL